MDLDLNKYKRLFTFGCSFTEYRFPTWANIASKMVPNAKFYNFGRSGGGNTLIANRITETHMKYNLCETDLVLIMWSTFCREDRWLPHHPKFNRPGWEAPGNIYSQKEWPFTDDKYLKNYGQPITYLIRDLSTITMTKGYLKSLPCDNFMMLSVPVDYQQDLTDPTTILMLDAYRPVFDQFPPDMLTHEMNGRWSEEIKYIPNWSDKPTIDYHPSPIRYCNYLKKLGFPVTPAVEHYAQVSYDKLMSIKYEKELFDLFPEESKIDFGKLLG